MPNRRKGHRGKLQGGEDVECTSVLNSTGREVGLFRVNKKGEERKDFNIQAHSLRCTKSFNTSGEVERTRRIETNWGCGELDPVKNFITLS